MARFEPGDRIVVYRFESMGSTQLTELTGWYCGERNGEVICLLMYPKDIVKMNCINETMFLRGSDEAAEHVSKIEQLTQKKCRVAFRETILPAHALCSDKCMPAEAC